jgi:biotin carboxyl carrier protein
MESMKMESTLVAPVAGRVAEVRFKEGDLVEMGDVVAVIEPI